MIKCLFDVPADISKLRLSRLGKVTAVHSIFTQENALPIYIRQNKFL
jgi:hypothetical protein